jgi:hypothetical protein
MSKYNRRASVRKVRRWYKNVGDGGKLSSQGSNPNDRKVSKDE